MKKNKSTILFDIETFTYHDSTNNQISRLYSLAKDLKRKSLNRLRKQKLNNLNNLNNEH